VLTLLLAGCATVPPVAPNIPLSAEQIPAWVASGRIAFIVDGGGGAGSFNWRQAGEDLRLAIRGPFGAGAIEIESDGRDLRLTDGSGQSLDTEQTRAQLQARLGADLPLDSLRYWMLGLPAPGGEARVTAASGSQPRVIEQSGWRVVYQGFKELEGFSLPARISAAGSNVRLKLLVDKWQLPPNSTASPGP
jgi:outer membrane lipoprotein LolB